MQKHVKKCKKVWYVKKKCYLCIVKLNKIEKIIKKEIKMEREWLKHALIDIAKEWLKYALIDIEYDSDKAKKDIEKALERLNKIEL